jgi:hypothetical protein
MSRVLVCFFVAWHGELVYEIRLVRPASCGARQTEKEKKKMFSTASCSIVIDFFAPNISSNDPKRALRDSGLDEAIKSTSNRSPIAH